MITCRRYRQKKVGVGKSSEELELDRIKELRKAAEEYLQESKKSFKKLMNNQGNQESCDTLEEENGKVKERGDQQRGTKRHRVCFCSVLLLVVMTTSTCASVFHIQRFSVIKLI